MKWFLATAALLFAGGGNAAPRDCKADMTDFRAWAKRMAATAPIACNMWTRSKLVSLDAADLKLLGQPDKLLRAAIITVEKDIITLDDKPEWQAPQPLSRLTQTLGADLTTLRENYQRIRPDVPFNGMSIFQIHPDAPWSVVSEAMRVVQQAKYPKIAIGFERPLGISAPPPSAIDAEVSTMAGERPVHNVEPLLQKVFANCPAAKQAVDSRRKVADDRRTAVLFEDTPRAIESCGCAVDLAAAKQLLWLLHPRFGCAMLNVNADASAPKTEAPADAPWSTMYRRVIQATRADAARRLNPAAR